MMAIWERGYRNHGLWQDGQRIAYIGLSVEHRKPLIVSWSFDLPHDNAQRGTCNTVRQAKAAINKALASYRKANAKP